MRGSEPILGPKSWDQRLRIRRICVGFPKLLAESIGPLYGRWDKRLESLAPPRVKSSQGYRCAAENIKEPCA